MSKKYLFIGDHAETLAGGLRVAPGEEVAATDVDIDADARLLDEGVLIEPAVARATADAPDDDADHTEPEGSSA